MLLFFGRLWLLCDNRKRFREKIKKLDVGNGVPLAKEWCVNVSKNVFTNKNPISVCVPVTVLVQT